MNRINVIVFVATCAVPRFFAQQPGIPHRSIESGRFEMPAQEVPATLQKIFSNLGPSTSAYSGYGWELSAPNNTFNPGYTEFLSLPFTPTADAHVSQVRAAISYSSGANQVNLSLYSDADGVPGTLLAGPVTVKNLPTACCSLAIANLTPSVAVAAGAQYWIVANAPTTGTGSDFFGSWQYVNASLKFGSNYVNLGDYWGAEPAVVEPAGAAYGTVP